MSNSLNKCKAEETAACCCVDVGTIIDDQECIVNFNRSFATKADAEQMLKTLTEKAKSVESEPCKIESHMTDNQEGVQLDITFTFSCSAESLIFQLALR